MLNPINLFYIPPPLTPPLPLVCPAAGDVRYEADCEENTNQASAGAGGGGGGTELDTGDHTPPHATLCARD